MDTSNYIYDLKKIKKRMRSIGKDPNQRRRKKEQRKEWTITDQRRRKKEKEKIEVNKIVRIDIETQKSKKKKKRWEAKKKEPMCTRVFWLANFHEHFPLSFLLILERNVFGGFGEKPPKSY